jgi:3-phenylpropionate/cinnamic acid dioxygenase small subunit
MKAASENTSESEPAINQHPVMNNSDIGNSKVNKGQIESCIENRLAIHFGDGSVNLVSAMKGARIRTTAASNIEEKSRSQISYSNHEIDEERERDIGNSKVNKGQIESCIENRLAIHFGDGSVNLVSAMKGARIRTTAASNIEEKSRSQISYSNHEIDEERESLSEEQHSGTPPRKCSAKVKIVSHHV